MKVILKADIKGVGKKDEVINASDGYARNFLFPKNLAVEANKENMAKLKARQDSTKFQKDQEREEALKVAEKLSKIQLKIKVINFLSTYYFSFILSSKFKFVSISVFEIK